MSSNNFIGTTTDECLSKLQAFGIPFDSIPKSPQDKENHNSLLEQRQKQEQLFLQQILLLRPRPIQSSLSSNPSPLSSLQQNQQHQQLNEIQGQITDQSNNSNTECFLPPRLDKATLAPICFPGPFDVMLGRGRRSNYHPGNIRLRGMCDDSKELYNASAKKGKTQITEKIVKAIKVSGRFLKEDGFGWVEVDDEVARLKVSHTFRDRSKNNEKKNNNNTSAKGSGSGCGTKQKSPEGSKKRSREEIK